ncbi:MAG: hypothetical protein ABRQ25_17160 [Clostridiaceae bacterium]
MKEKVWINIPAKYKDKLSQWVDFFGYDSEDENGKLVVYRFLTDSKEYEQITYFLQQKNINFYIFRREYAFTKKEKDNAQILRLRIDDDAKDSCYLEDDMHRCSKCNRLIPQVQRKELHVDYKKIKKYDFMVTYEGTVETIVSDKVRQILLRENISVR